MQIHLISYGDQNYESQKEFFAASAIASGFFDDMVIFEPEDIDSVFKTRFKTILNTNKGGGYWAWKPYFVKQVFDSLPDDDILVYCDSGCMINSEGKERFNDYISLLNQSDTGSLAFELPHKETEYTKREIFELLDAPGHVINSNQLMATVLLFKKCEHTSFLINRWYYLFCSFPLSFADDYDPEISSPDFIDGRHDQSVFSVIRKMYGTEVIADETYFSDFIRDGYHFPIWATRLKR